MLRPPPCQCMYICSYIWVSTDLHSNHSLTGGHASEIYSKYPMRLTHSDCGRYRLYLMWGDSHSDFTKPKAEWNPYANQLLWDMTCIFHSHVLFYVTDTLYPCCLPVENAKLYPTPNSTPKMLYGTISPYCECNSRTCVKWQPWRENVFI